MRKVDLRMNELEKYETIRKVYYGKTTKARAEIELQLSRRQIDRLLIRYKEYGKYGFMHGNRGRKPITALSNELQNLIEDLYITKYFDCTYTLFTELLAERENISISKDTVRNILLSKDILSPKSHRQTKRDLKKKLKETIKKSKSKKEVELSKAKIVNIENAHPTQPRCSYFGEEVQLDASEHIWFGNKKTHLHAAIDDSTGKVLGAYFDTQETLYGYYTITKQMIEKYGIPYKIKADKRTVFEYKKKDAIPDENDTFTQYSYAAKQLGILIETSSVPEFKARVERLFGTFQHRLNVLLRLEKITTIEEANNFLPKFIEKYNTRFAVQEDNTKNAFEKQVSIEKINLTLAILSRRSIDSGHSLRFKNKYYRLVNSRNIPIYFAKRTKCIVIEAYDKTLYATIDNNIFAMQEIPKFQAISENFDDIQEIKECHIYIPKMMHPWKKESFEKFIIKQKHRFESKKHLVLT